jgi:hypothetical protein
MPGEIVGCVVGSDARPMKRIRLVLASFSVFFGDEHEDDDEDDFHKRTSDLGQDLLKGSRSAGDRGDQISESCVKGHSRCGASSNTWSI